MIVRAKVHSSGIDALDSLLSHDPELLVGDDGEPGLVTADEYRALVALLSNLRSPFVEGVSP